MLYKYFCISLLLTFVFYLSCSDEPTSNNDSENDIIKTVQIGEQVWMAENLHVTHYRNWDPIPNVTVDTEWSNLTTGAYCNYDNDVSNVATYGRLYNWYAVNDSRNIAPEGWHMPSDVEWKQLEMFLGMSQEDADDSGDYRGTDEGEKLKEAGTNHWISPNNGTNESGFTALPGGTRAYGNFNAKGGGAVFWSSTEDSSNSAFYRTLFIERSGIRRGSIYKRFGHSVRCVRD